MCALCSINSITEIAFRCNSNLIKSKSCSNEAERGLYIVITCAVLFRWICIPHGGWKLFRTQQPKEWKVISVKGSKMNYHPQPQNWVLLEGVLCLVILLSY